MEGPLVGWIPVIWQAQGVHPGASSNPDALPVHTYPHNKPPFLKMAWGYLVLAIKMLTHPIDK